MKSTHLRVRYYRIMTFFAGATLEFILWELFLARLGFRKIVRRNRSERFRRVAYRFRNLSIRMGGVMIKVGQFLSSRLDVLPVEMTRELSSLQDEVPPEKFESIRELAEAELQMPLHEAFETFEEIPLAAASLGQVHRGLLHSFNDGQDFRQVVVKVQRPHIEELIEVDLSALRRFGGWLQKYQPISRRVNVPALVEEFSVITRAEIDYLAEGSNAETFAKNFKDFPRVQVPRVVWSSTTRRVLTLEDVFAIKITDYDAITDAGIDRDEVARELLATYLKQIFEDGFFHADPHPGNLFITPLSLEDSRLDWRLTFVDFGMVGYVPANLRRGLHELLVSIGTRDAARLVRSYQTLNLLLPGADLQLIEQAEAELFELFWGKSMSELRNINHAEIFRYAERFRQLMYDLPFQLPQNLLMLGRTVAILSGMCTGLNKDFNLWIQLAPYAAHLVAGENESSWKIWLEEIGSVVKELIALPSQASRLISRMERGELSIRVPGINPHLSSLEKAVNRLTGAVIFCALVIGATLLNNAHYDILATILYTLSAVIFLWIFFNRGNGPWHFHP